MIVNILISMCIGLLIMIALIYQKVQAHAEKQKKKQIRKSRISQEPIMIEHPAVSDYPELFEMIQGQLILRK